VSLPGSAQALISAGQTTNLFFSLGDPRFCKAVAPVLFPNASSFIEPTAGNKAALRAALARLRAVPGERVVVVGHTDDVGGLTGVSGNQALSERRAEATLAALRGQAAVWETVFQLEKQGVNQPPWSAGDFRTMLTEARGAAPSQIEVLQHREISAAGAALRAVLFPQYFAALLGAPGGSVAVPTLVPESLGCNEQHALGTGNHAPSRRAEIFFFGGTASPTVDCASYPLWSTPCVLPPPTPTTVTLSQLDTVPVGGTATVQVTVSPSPLPAGTTVTLTLSSTGAGDAVFVANGTHTLVISGSGSHEIRGVTASAVTDDQHLTATVTGAAAVLATEAFTVVRAFVFFLQFDVWSLTTHDYEPLNGRRVRLMDQDPGSNDRIATETTDAAGRVFFNLSDISTASGEAQPDLFFVIELGGNAHGHQLPAEWSTAGWLATDGTPGLQPSFSGSGLGSPTRPLVFRAGLDFHARLEYHVDAGGRAGHDDPAPAGVRVELMEEDVGPDRVLVSTRTGRDGRIDVVAFDAEPGSTFYLRVHLEIEDAAIHLSRGRFLLFDALARDFQPVIWNSTDDDADRKRFADHRNTSIGTFAGPEVFRATTGDRHVGLYYLKIWRELAVFLFEMTRGDWPGVEMDVAFSAPVTAFSWPVGQVNLHHPDDLWDRETLMHETGHQVMWRMVNFSSLSIAYQATFGNLQLFHRADLHSNPVHALIEGWAEFVEAIFEGAGTPPFRVGSPVDSSGDPLSPPGLGPPPNDRGESIEGALANGLWGIFESEVAGSAAGGSARVTESTDGDVTATAPWITQAAVKTRFTAMIWNPLKRLAPLSSPDSTALLANIRAGNPDDWHRLLPELQAFNMSMRRPAALHLTPDWGPPTGGGAIGMTVTITGEDFIRTKTLGATTLETTVRFGTAAGTGVSVTRHTTLVVVPPAGTGVVDVTVTTPAGTSAALRFRYVDDPLSITDVSTPGPGGALSPRVVSTLGGDSLDITGQGFLPGAVVEIGGGPLDPADVVVQRPDLILVTRTPPRPAGPVAIRVVNPPGAVDDILAGRLRYAEPPRVIRMVTPPSRSGAADQSHEIVLLADNVQPDATVTDGVSSFVVTLAGASGGTEVRFTLGPGPVGLVDLRLENPSDGLSAPFDFFRAAP
jgi:hypothetical protein